MKTVTRLERLPNSTFRDQAIFVEVSASERKKSLSLTPQSSDAVKKSDRKTVHNVSIDRCLTGTMTTNLRAIAN
jgi:hypothetical protein